MSHLVEIKNLSVDFKTAHGLVHAVKDVSFSIQPGETLGLVGESGSGKSVTSLALMGLLPEKTAVIPNGEILFEGVDLLQQTEAELRGLRGRQVSMIFQEPMTSLNPVFIIGDQIAEVLKIHKGWTAQKCKARVIELLDEVGIPTPESKYKSYPHEMSGGQRQRVMIAMAMACEPQLLIADEPTTALDVTIQKQILDLLASLKNKYQMSVLFITHDLAVIGDIADRVAVMYRGELVEEGSTSSIFKTPSHPYTKALLNCRPGQNDKWHSLPTVSDFVSLEGEEQQPDLSKFEQPRVRKMSGEVLLDVQSVSKTYKVKSSSLFGANSYFQALDKVSFQVKKGTTFGVVGESGCGKTTLGRILVGLLSSDSGDIFFDGRSAQEMQQKNHLEWCRRVQMIFQDPYASLNPRMTVGSALVEPMKIHSLGADAKERRQKAQELLVKVGLDESSAFRYPHEFSGGQRQRICIARALALQPEFIICDESVSALDVSVQAQVLNLLLDLQSEFDLTYLFISHDLSVVKFIADEVIVMNKGQIVESGKIDSVYTKPQSSYTKSLLDSVPTGLVKL